jgi:ABC-type phosphate/phosphonate transport system ATPase subunit
LLADEPVTSLDPESAEGFLTLLRGIMREHRMTVLCSLHQPVLAERFADTARVLQVLAILYCASGGRSALSGKVLKDMGYDRVYNLGAFKDWAETGGTLEIRSDNSIPLLRRSGLPAPP